MRVAGVETVGLAGLAAGSSRWPCCPGAETATPTNNDTSATDQGRVIVFSPRASFRFKKQHGHIDIVLNPGGGDAAKQIGKKTVSVGAHGH